MHIEIHRAFQQKYVAVTLIWQDRAHERKVKCKGNDWTTDKGMGWLTNTTSLIWGRGCRGGLCKNRSLLAAYKIGQKGVGEFEEFPLLFTVGYRLGG